MDNTYTCVATGELLSDRAFHVPPGQEPHHAGALLGSDADMQGPTSTRVCRTPRQGPWGSPAAPGRAEEARPNPVSTKYPPDEISGGGSLILAAVLHTLSPYVQYHPPPLTANSFNSRDQGKAPSSAIGLCNHSAVLVSKRFNLRAMSDGMKFQVCRGFHLSCGPTAPLEIPPAAYQSAGSGWYLHIFISTCPQG
ncbi:hypothetical protein VUR80DRAFT_6168 [Thermomyces stellatus]